LVFFFIGGYGVFLLDAPMKSDLATRAVQRGTQTMQLPVLAGVGTGAAVGAINGAAVAIFKLPAIIVTLAMLSIVRGTALIVGGPILHQLRGGTAYSFIGTGFLFGVPFSIWLSVGVVAAMVFLQTRTCPFRKFDPSGFAA
jgi:ribose/xylose/arabinose/galactoside ABC-type transport system permease subunit